MWQECFNTAKWIAIIAIILLVILWGVGAIIARLDDGSNWASSANAFMTEGAIANPLMTNNPLLKIMGITLS